MVQVQEPPCTSSNQLLCFGATKTVTETPPPCRKPTRAVCLNYLCSSWVMVSFTEPTNWTCNSSRVQETFIQAVNCFKLIVNSGGRWCPKSAIPYLWDYMSSVCIPKLKFLRGASNLDIYTIRTNKNTKLAQVKYTGLPACVLYKLFCQAKQILALTQMDMQTTPQCSWTYTNNI